MFWILVALFVLYPYARCFYKRLICRSKLKRMCKKKGYKLHKTHPFWFLGYKHTERCDCYIETPNEIFAVKLFGMKNRHSTLVFVRSRKYQIMHTEVSEYTFVRRFRTRNGTSTNSIVTREAMSKPKSLPLYDFRYNYKPEWEIKTPRSILLVNPVCMDFLSWVNENGPQVISAGEIVYGMEITFLPRFLGTLEDAI